MAASTRQTSRSTPDWRRDLALIANEAGSFAAGPYPRVLRGVGTTTLGPSGSRRLTAGLTNEPKRRVPKSRFKVGIDYGTTFSGVSYAVNKLNEDDDSVLRSSDVKTIKNWPHEPTGLAEQVPTESWYPAVPMQRTAPYNQFDSPKYIPRIGRVLHRDESDIEGYSAPDQPHGARHSEKLIEVSDASGIHDQPGAPDKSTEFLWGYSVAFHKLQYGHNRDPSRIIERPKLMLLGTSYTEHGRRKLRHQIDALLEQKLIRKYGKMSEPDVRDVRDIVTDYLTELLRHTKSQLSIYEDYTEGCPVEFTIAAPAIWSSESSRILQFSMEAAILASGFGSLTDGRRSGLIRAGSIDNLFIGPEPDCGITWLLHNSHETVPGSVITSLDCGGGTVDAVTYQVGDYPLRLTRKVVDPGGDNCGGSYLNQEFKALVKYRLRDEAYLCETGYTLDYIADKACMFFETHEKREKDVLKKPCGSVEIPNLRGDMAKNFENNVMMMDQDDYWKIFGKILGRVWQVLKSQLDAALEKNEQVRVVFMFGGFAGAPSLRSYINHKLAQYGKDMKLLYTIKLIQDARKTVAAISAGSVLRALDPRLGPKRKGLSSYGFLCREPFEARLHGRAIPDIDPVDGDQYVAVLNYFMPKGQDYLDYQELEPIRFCHTFLKEDEDRAMLCEELLYVSDTATISHKKLTHPSNINAQEAGKIVTDMTFLKDENMIELISPEPDSQGIREPYYKIEYDLVPIIEKRNLRIEARWPASSSDDLDGDRSGMKPRKRRRNTQRNVNVRMTAQISIAATFEPGTS
ncbi:hypothetical protein BKA65DRAFT_443255 [Rhexocercosporidium sp. MPI-PUGE-AT-0058]|nr:hypothetical protein BKA65DRAFT_443255 [Rhexocercosporidium sp. MPI-PUGE-AT-0058]